MVQSCARIISELKTLIKLQNGGNFIIDILHIYKILFFNVYDEDRHQEKNQNTKTKKQNSTTTKNNGNTKRCIDKEPCNAVFLITDESLMHFRDSLSDDHSSAFWLHHLVATMTNSQNTHIVMTEKSPQSPTSIRLTTIL